VVKKRGILPEPCHHASAPPLPTMNRMARALCVRDAGARFSWLGSSAPVARSLTR
jgi:hypothetical protein